MKEKGTVEPAEGQKVGLITCEGVGGVQGALTLNVGGVAQTCHDDRVVELKEQLVVEEASQRVCAMDGMEMVMMRLRT